MKKIMAIFLISSIVIYSHSDQVVDQSFGFMAGLKHPIMGLDHLLAMLCVGMISSRIGQRAIWQVPACFVLVMAIGCIIGFFGTSIQFVELLIACSIIVFGGLLTIPTFLSLNITLITVGVLRLLMGMLMEKKCLFSYYQKFTF